MYQGFFINLDRNEQRRTALTQHLAERGAASRYRRIAAVDGRTVPQQHQTKLDPGALGLWLTHLKLLEAHRGTDAHLHVIEDDTILATNVVNEFDQILEQADTLIDGWDLIFTDIHIPTDEATPFRKLSSKLKDLNHATDVAVIDLQPFSFAGTSSIFFNRHSIDKYLDLISNAWAAALPIDLYIRDLVNRGQLNAYLTVPFLTSVSRDALQSDIRGDLDRSRAVTTVFRRAFFRDADLQLLDAEIEKLTKGATFSALAAIYAKMFSFKLSDQWVSF